MPGTRYPVPPGDGRDAGTGLGRSSAPGVLNRTPSEPDRRRLRRAGNRVLTERRAPANTAARQVGGAA
ncbi:DUF6284 family protein [Streptomyces sp. SPB074]|uniref:DUF6284 family protein n=1 Tax=Streptomyces sp. (strain SPB074) TaxID=465543 RepID=UPI000D0AA0E2|nr:DUF6284 family protein [Streptomyces sp. SPB074]